MYVDGPWTVISNRDAVKFELGMAPMPAGPGGSKHYTAGSGFGISKQCATPEAAFQAIVSMTGDKALTGLASVGRAYPARPAVARGLVHRRQDRGRPRNARLRRVALGALAHPAELGPGR